MAAASREFFRLEPQLQCEIPCGVAHEAVLVLTKPTSQAAGNWMASRFSLSRSELKCSMDADSTATNRLVVRRFMQNWTEKAVTTCFGMVAPCTRKPAVVSRPIQLAGRKRIHGSSARSFSATCRLRAQVLPSPHAT